jgi:hypothetical protein
MRTVLRLAAGALVALTAACDPTETAARARAANEFDCPSEKVDLRDRPDWSAGTYDVFACGHEARYTCTPAGAFPGKSRWNEVCSREPLE